MSSADTSLSAEMQTAQAGWHDPSVAERYANAENATKVFAKLVVEKAQLLKDENIHVFDLATGTGVLVKEVYDIVPKERWGNVKVLGGDVSESMLGYLKARGEKEGWTGLTTQVVDGNDMSALPKETFTHATCTFAIFVIPSCLSTLRSLLKPGGFVGIATWGNVPWYSLLHRSIAQIPDAPYNPSEAEIEDKLFSGKPWGNAEYVAAQIRDAGFENVQTEVKRSMAKIGSPKAFMQTMQFPLTMAKSFWPEDKQDTYFKQLIEIMNREVVQMAGGEDKEVEMEFEGLVGWGWKPAS